jgi:hypothetical protein
LAERTHANSINGRWSKKYERCRRCGRADLPHAGRGLCRTCYSHWYHHNKLTMEPLQRSHVRRVREGIEEFRCNGRCNRWLPREAYAFKGQHTGWGIHTTCKACHRLNINERYAREGPHPTKHPDKKQLRQADREWAAWKRKHQTITVPTYIVAGWIRELIQTAKDDESRYPLYDVFLLTKVQTRTMYAILHAERRTTAFAIAERIAEAANHLDELYRLLPDMGRDGWSRRSRWCCRCGSWFHPHFAKGLCARCYSSAHRAKTNGLAVAPPKGETWALWWPCCVVCERIDKVHRGRGLCAVCWHKLKRIHGIEWVRDNYPTMAESRRRALDAERTLTLA